MRIIQSSFLDVKVRGNEIFSLIKNGEFIRLVKMKFDSDLRLTDEIAYFKGSKGFLLEVERTLLVSIDDTIFLVEGDRRKVILRANRPENFFWRSTEASDRIFIQEYGRPPTSIYASRDFEKWERIVTNVDIDRNSRHFHSIAWDRYRNWLIATLGDNCLTRVVYSEDFGRSWKPLYKGAWQLLPIVVSEDEIVFGMDSGIARGGVGIFYPKDYRWKFEFFKWLDKRVRLAQMCDLKLLDGDIWTATFGSPQAIAVSKDLRAWHPVYVESYDESFNFHMLMSIVGNTTLFSTSKHLIIIDKEELNKIIINEKPATRSYKAYKERFKGIFFVLKRKLEGRYLNNSYT